MKKIFFASDHAGLELKRALIERSSATGHEVRDFGTDNADSCDYPDFAHALCEALKSSPEALGVLVCGTGIGMSISANRHAHIRAALCGDLFSAQATREHNNANVLCLGSRVTGPGLAEKIFEVFVGTEFEGGRHQRRIDKITPK